MPAELRPGGNSGRSVFVYYKVDSDNAASLLQAVARLEMMPAPWRVRLMKRVDAAASDVSASRAAPAAVIAQTWMEVYTLDIGERREPADWIHLIETRARKAGIVALVDGGRHYEVFDECA